jgi:DTW domain-containing protein YfiP
MMDDSSIVVAEASSIVSEKRLKYRERNRNANARQNKRRRRAVKGSTADSSINCFSDLPEIFDCDELAKIINSAACGQENVLDSKYYHTLPLTYGLLLKLRSGINRLYRYSEFKFNRNLSEQANQFYALVSYMCHDEDRENLLFSNWSSSKEELWSMSDELSFKTRNLPKMLSKELGEHSVYPMVTRENAKLMQFHSYFVSKVNKYFEKVKRPDGTFELPFSTFTTLKLDTERKNDDENTVADGNGDELMDNEKQVSTEEGKSGKEVSSEQEQEKTIKALLELPRIKCTSCGHYRKIYCGECGIPVENAISIVPSPVSLPFDVLLLLHYQESLTKCTGVHASVLCQRNTVSHWDWEKPLEISQSLIEKLDSENDIILFPYSNAVPAESFPWDGSNESNADSLPSDYSRSMNREEKIVLEEQQAVTRKKKRLVVLEASWGYGKTMAQQILDHRKAKGLPPLKSIILTNVIGEYWRFQEEGKHAVSTIEAIAYSAKAAGLDEKSFQQLLLLFRLQKYRVLQNTRENGKPPRAIEVSGSGKGSWKNISIIDDIDGDEDEDNADSKADEDL